MKFLKNWRDNTIEFMYDLLYETLFTVFICWEKDKQQWEKIYQSKLL